mmetsp:Transcript_42275/g.47761  ORF Transcript_42275/g.47761 Transcript_42275/m.47761 type:complete len:500 (+) Transcript_42275:131-1630(+)|eukprot:CAMPEP_0170880638 /NCGR_PEP_ID=MMETSP0734-20130129/32554_1 /TAXON_ID=186038 /ORGANISM="Fragilariopsis kerguelensis, Strain L26-C5" /LENGTH=499 /DNA_ID=CAMNT_0011264199 /DNA_START=180 /DNA_END=1679 /DNA_ORIENTATION=+
MVSSTTKTTVSSSSSSSKKSKSSSSSNSNSNSNSDKDNNNQKSKSSYNFSGSGVNNNSSSNKATTVTKSGHTKKKTGPKTGHSRSYPRGVGLDFRKLAGLTLVSYIDHHGVKVRPEAPPSELAVAVARHFEQMEVDEEEVIGGFLERLEEGPTVATEYSRKTQRYPIPTTTLVSSSSSSLNKSGNNISFETKKAAALAAAAAAAADNKKKGKDGKNIGGIGGNDGKAGVAGATITPDGTAAGTKSNLNNNIAVGAFGAAEINTSTPGAITTNPTTITTNSTSQNAATRIMNRKRTKWAARPGEQVAAKVTRTDENGSWILASVQRFYVDTETYDVQDEDDTSKLIRLPWSHVMRLSTGAEGCFVKGADCMAIFPETTSFYKSLVAKSPVWKLDHGVPCVKEIVVQFDDDEDINTHKTPKRRVPSRYVIPTPEAYFYDEHEDVDLLSPTLSNRGGISTTTKPSKLTLKTITLSTAATEIATGSGSNIVPVVPIATAVAEN